MANLSGLLNGQTDPILTINGRKCANILYPGLYKSFGKISGIWTSDLQRCYTFADIATGFYGEGFWKKARELREIDFGDVRGLPSIEETFLAVFLINSNSNKKIG